MGPEWTHFEEKLRELLSSLQTDQGGSPSTVDKIIRLALLSPGASFARACLAQARKIAGFPESESDWTLKHHIIKEVFRKRSVAPVNSPISPNVLQEAAREVLSVLEESGRKEAIQSHPVDDKPRYLQAQVKAEDDKVIEAALPPDAVHQLVVRIGYPDEQFVHGTDMFPPEAVFEHSKEDIEIINLVCILNTSNKPQTAQIRLPRIGNSEETIFSFTTGKNDAVFEADILAYHNCRVIQHALFSAPVATGQQVAGRLKQNIKVIFCVRKNLSGISERTKFAWSLFFDFVSQKKSKVLAMTGEGEVDLNSANGLAALIHEMKDEIQTVLKEDEADEGGLEAEENKNLLLYLATQGSILYTNFLKKTASLEGPLQIISNSKSYLPIELVYSYPPIDGGDAVTVCPDASAALCSGACCGRKEARTDPATMVCPLGFWGLSRIIERHNFDKQTKSGVDYCVVSEPVKDRNTLHVLNNALFGSSKRVDNAGNGMREQIAACIKDVTSTLSQTDDWDEWRKLATAEKPDSMVLVVHIEKDKVRKTDMLEIGDKKFLLQTLIGSKVILKHSSPAPFVIVLGCKSTNLENQAFDVSSSFISAGAAIVLSNFTRITGNHAKDILDTLLTLIEENDGEEMLFGEVVLKLRQQLLAKGKMVALSLIAQGDADWKIKN
ncbi:hypothetical protein SAMN05216327_12048 [Dyadobacter sp. SG02]|nr:hypothetical protein SAMN05216327_12048 [Dyadobacter sp. SG02]